MDSISRSKRSALVRSDIRGAVFDEAVRMGKAGIDVLRLNSGNLALFGFKMPESVRNALLDSLEACTGYCDLRGMPAARQAICDYHLSKGIQNITPDNIFIGNGVCEVAQMAITTLLDDGDELLLPAPGYSLWSNCAYLAGAKPVHYICDESSDWFPDPADIRRKITPNTKAIVIINPNNPTGALYSRELLEELLQIAREHNLVVFCDEIYDRLLLDDNEHISAAALADDLVFVTLNGLSKSHVVCGLRSGWLCVSGAMDKAKELLTGIQELCSMRVCGNVPAQAIVPAALADPESTRAMMVPGGRMYEQRKATVDVLRQIPGISFVENKATFYLFPKLDVKKFRITSDQQFAMDFLHEKHVMIIPGSGFNWSQPDHFRIVMLPEAPVLSNAMTDLKDFLSSYRQAV